VVQKCVEHEFNVRFFVSEEEFGDVVQVEHYMNSPDPTNVAAWSGHRAAARDMAIVSQ
jgi:hypothetical protein